MTAPARTVFLGSGMFAVPILDALLRHPRVDLRAVVTAPPRPAGRRRKMIASAVGSHAATLGLSVLAPERLRAPEAIEAIERQAPALIVLADYGRMVPGALLDAPRHGALNLHPSLLPRHRGAAPIAAAILEGDRRTGVSLMRMDEGLDTGPLIAVREMELQGDEIAPVLEAALADMAADLLVRSLAAWLDGELSAVTQGGEGASLTRPLRRADGRLDPQRPAEVLERQVRAYQPWPGSFLETAAGRLIVWRSRVLGQDEVLSESLASDGPGVIVAAGQRPALVTAAGVLELVEVQPAGGQRMPGSALLLGRGTLVGSRVRDGTVG
ncbi:MAG: methionyl-tRNA formyltransferase [Chloroflexi bacterium]|nr:methionyl-tRNA formyltransferase [Chloroflexota bacterium]